MIDLTEGLKAEIDWLKTHSRSSSYSLVDGKLLSFLGKNTIENKATGVYSFKNEEHIELSSERVLLCTIGSEKYNGQVEFCDDESIEISIVGFVENEINHVLIEINSWQLLEKLQERISNVRKNKIVEMIQ